MMTMHTQREYDAVVAERDAAQQRAEKAEAETESLRKAIRSDIARDIKFRLQDEEILRLKEAESHWASACDRLAAQVEAMQSVIDRAIVVLPELIAAYGYDDDVLDVRKSGKALLERCAALAAQEGK